MIPLKENVKIAPYTTIGIGGNARFFAEPADRAELLEVITYAKLNNLPHFILGGGSNLIFTESEYPGIVIRPRFMELTIEDTGATVGSGVELAAVINETLNAGLVGMEFAAGIPGTVGGAIRGNAGTFGVNMDSVITRVTAYVLESGEIKTYSRSACAFAYRHSIFKEIDAVIVSAELKLQHGNVEDSRDLIDARIRKRKEVHPTEPSAGCIFKNIPFDRINLEDLRKRGIEIERFEEFKKIPVGYLIDVLNLKGKQIGGAAVSKKHGNYIINTGSASFDDMIMLISFLKQQVRDAFNIQLEEEAQIVT